MKLKLTFLHSPTDTEFYPHGADCVWVIRTNLATVIRLTWLTFAIEESHDCNFDSVEIYDGSARNNFTSMGRFCGNDLPPAMTSSSNELTVVFKSDSSIAREGFTASFVALDGSLGTSLIYFFGIKNHHFSLTFFAIVCGGVYHSTFGVIRSPDWPSNYGHDRQCTWKIQVPAGQQIMLNFTVFDMENHTNCNYDFLEIR